MNSRIVKEFLIVTVLAVTFVACQKSAPVEVPPLQSYRDALNLFAISVPADWQQSSEPGKLNIYNSQDAWNKFADPSSSSKPGVRIYIYAQDIGGQRLQDVVEQFKDNLRQQQAQIDPDVQTTLAGIPAVKIPYALRIDNRNTIYGSAVLAVADSIEYGYECQGFNKEFKRYAPIFDTVQTTYQIIPKAVAKQQLPEDLIPSSTFATYQNDVFSIQYPANFTATPKGASGDLQSSVIVQGYRVDCTIQVDVLDAKKLTVEKVFDQNKGKYPNVSGTKKIQLDGLEAYQINYSTMRGIQSRAYFVVKNNKWIRVTLNWATEMQKDFLPAFEKAVSSLRLK